MVLHTCFSLVLTGMLYLALRAPIDNLVRRAEVDTADAILDLFADGAVAESDDDRLRAGTAAELGLTATAVDTLENVGRHVTVDHDAEGTVRATRLEDGRYAMVSVESPGVRSGVRQIYLLLIAALIAIYALIVLVLEVLVLPRHVYGPIGTMLDADDAALRRDYRDELIPERMIPKDELGSIMRSRNETIEALRREERALEQALQRLEEVATDLKRKNHLLENARRNLEGADRLASLGMMSAGIAHELNTPLAVVKGLVDKLADSTSRSLPPSEAQLLRRVVGRLERLGDSLLDYARARSTQRRSAVLRDVVEESLTLVRIDRHAEGVEIENEVASDIELSCDADRMIQVFVNLVRNAVNAMVENGLSGRVVVRASRESRGGDAWIGVRVIDDGPGIDPAVLPNLFEPFVTGRLDANGTGLGLAVAEGIVREHAGTLIARNRPEGGAEFEVLLPMDTPLMGTSPESGSAEAADGGNMPRTTDGEA